jgi:iduronate 2-sulfatase
MRCSSKSPACHSLPAPCPVRRMDPDRCRHRAFQALDDPPSWNANVNPKGIDKAEESKLTNYTPGRGPGSALCFYASPAKDEEHTDGMVASEIIRLKDENRNRAWFLGAGFYRPHWPYIAPSKYFDRVPLSKVKLVPFEDWEISVAPDWATLRSLQIGG